MLREKGFTLIELVMVIVILGVLSAFALPRFADLGTQAKVATLEGIEGSLKSTIAIVKAKAYTQGLSRSDSNPGGSQSDYIVTTDAGSAEVDWRNLCPESSAELGDALDMSDHIGLEATGDLSVQTNNQYTLIGYDVPGFSVPTNQGCYIIYDSFGDPNCTVTLVTEDC